MIRSRMNLVCWFFSVAFLAPSTQAALTWPGCKDVANTDFKATNLATRAADTVAEPMKMAFDLLAAPGEDAKGKVDVYFTERLGKVRKFDSKLSKVLTLATIPLDIDEANSSDGVLGIALDPAFKTNHQVFLYYSFVTTAEKSWRVSRFTLNASHDKMDLTSEVPVIKIPIRSGSRHPGGAIKFDAYGDLWITTGNDYLDGKDFPVWSSANTNDLRGKILRIHPTPDGKYTIPEGNLFKPNTPETKPEIYIMGNRNPYTLALDPVRRWVLWGDVGPDAKDMDGLAMNGAGSTYKTEEYDLAQAPGNYGYPFFAGENTMLAGMNPASPVIPANTDWNGYTPGLKTLPPAVVPIYPYKQSCAITGPLYRYDGALNSSVKFPPHFTRKWLVSDFNGDNNAIKAFTLSDDGKKVTAEEPVIGIPLHAPLDIESGPDGAIYVNNYAGYRSSSANTGIVRIDYTGDCRPSEPTLEKVVVGVRNENRWSGPGLEITHAHGISVVVTAIGTFTLEVHDILGRPIAMRTGRGQMLLTLPEINRAGLYFISIDAPEGRSTRKFVRE